MLNQAHILTAEKPIDITQSTESVDGQEIKTVILSLKEGLETIEFD